MKMLGLKLGNPMVKFQSGTRLQCGTVTNLMTSTSYVSCNDVGDEFPCFLPKEVNNVKDPFVRSLAKRNQRLPVQLCLMIQILLHLLHCFDSNCLEWRCTYPLLEEAGLETWAIDVLGWGFSDLENFPPCNPSTKRDHLYQFWKSHIKRPMILVGPSLGAAIAIDFAVNFPEAVEKLVLINASVYAESNCFKMPKIMAYTMVSLLKSIPMRLFANFMVFDGLSLSTIIDWTKASRLHCLLPWWAYATVNYMLGGGYNVTPQIEHVQQEVLIIWGERDNILSSEHGERLQKELRNATLSLVPASGHFPHVEKPESVARLIAGFAKEMASKIDPCFHDV
ncbi:serine protease [Lithospermum erythrorhizon]|uniref:Serine protease n=1 Tax=Lithospermum erythrorhizon TaxID=34254 RepID=A0AAV3RWC2_LITER